MVPGSRERKKDGEGGQEINLLALYGPFFKLISLFLVSIIYFSESSSSCYLHSLGILGFLIATTERDRVEYIYIFLSVIDNLKK